MPYNKQQWNNTSAGSTPISADRLEHMEDGIALAVDAAETAESNASVAASAAAIATGAVSTLTTQVTDLSNEVGSAVSGSDFTSKGAMVVGTNAGSSATLPAGEDDRVLQADSTAATGVIWGRKISTSDTPPPSPSVDDIWLKPRP